MVTVIGYEPRTNSEGEVFNALILQGDVELVQSKETGNHYATARKTSITSTLGDAVCEKLVGKELPGRIIREEAEPYDFTVPETEEVIQLSHSYRYEPEEVEEPVQKKASREETLLEELELA